MTNIQYCENQIESSVVCRAAFGSHLTLKGWNICLARCDQFMWLYEAEIRINPTVWRAAKVPLQLVWNRSCCTLCAFRRCCGHLATAASPLQHCKSKVFKDFLWKPLNICSWNRGIRPGWRYITDSWLRSNSSSGPLMCVKQIWGPI